MVENIRVHTLSKTSWKGTQSTVRKKPTMLTSYCLPTLSRLGWWFPLWFWKLPWVASLPQLRIHLYSLRMRFVILCDLMTKSWASCRLLKNQLATMTLPNKIGRSCKSTARGTMWVLRYFIVSHVCHHRYWCQKKAKRGWLSWPNILLYLSHLWRPTSKVLRGRAKDNRQRNGTFLQEH